MVVEPPQANVSPGAHQSSDVSAVSRRPSDISGVSLATRPISGASISSGEVFEPPHRRKPTDPVKVSQIALNQWCRQLKLSIRKSLLLARSLNGNNLLAEGVQITSVATRHAVFDQFFIANEENVLAHCHDIRALAAAINIQYK